MARNEVKRWQYVTPDGQIKNIDAREQENVGIDTLKKMGVLKEVKPRSRLQQLYDECESKYAKLRNRDYFAGYLDALRRVKEDLLCQD